MSTAKKYYEICEQIKQLEKQKTELRALLLGVIGESPAVLLDGVMITQDFRERKTLDREALTVALGIEGIKKFEKITQYSELRCKVIA
jgi:hypothetical protein